jgi:hypothetical protein
MHNVMRRQNKDEIIFRFQKASKANSETYSSSKSLDKQLTGELFCHSNLSFTQNIFYFFSLLLSYKPP